MRGMEVLWVLAAGVWLGVKLHEAWEAMPEHGGSGAASSEPGAVALGVCACARCQPRFHQKRPVEVQ